MEQKNKLVRAVKPSIDYELMEKVIGKANNMANSYLLKQGVSQKAIDFMKKSTIELEVFGVTPIDWSGKSDKSDNRKEV